MLLRNLHARHCLADGREDLELETLEDRRLSLRLILMYKVVEVLVPTLPTDNFVKLARPKRNIFLVVR
jgi:hypothetical protein